MGFRKRVVHLAVAGLMVAAVSCSDSVTPVQPDVITGGPADANMGFGFGAGQDHALSFDGATATASTPQGTVITSQIDNLTVDVMVRYDGPNAANGHQTVFYNGNGSVSGWGILILGTADGATPGTVAMLTGGQQIIQTPYVLSVGHWHHIIIERGLRGNTTLMVDNQTESLGSVAAAPVGGSFASIEHTSVGGDGTFDAPAGDLNGAVDDLTLSDADSHQVIESWHFDEGHGSTTTGVNGGVLQLGQTEWTRGEGQFANLRNASWALAFDGNTADASTPNGNPAFLQSNDMSVALTVRLNGANASNGHQTLYINGNGGTRGWGILALGTQDGYPTGTLAFLAGGITVAPTPFVLRPNRWAYVRVKRDADGHTWFALNDSVVDMGVIPVNPVSPASDAAINIQDRTSVGGDGTFDNPTGSFNGTIGDLVVWDLGSHRLIDWWKFDDGTGGVATGVNGGMLFIGTAQWVHRGFDWDRGFGRDYTHDFGRGFWHESRPGRGRHHHN